MRLGPDLLQLSSSERLQSRRCLASPKNHLPHVDGPKALRPDAPQPKPAQTRLVGATTQPNLNPIKLIKIPLKTDRTSFGATGVVLIRPGPDENYRLAPKASARRQFLAVI